LLCGAILPEKMSFSSIAASVAWTTGVRHAGGVAAEFPFLLIPQGVVDILFHFVCLCKPTVYFVRSAVSVFIAYCQTEQVMTAIFPLHTGKHGTESLISPVVQSLFCYILPSVPVIPLPTGPLETLKYKFILLCFIQRIAILLAVASSGAGNRVMTSSPGGSWMQEQSETITSKTLADVGGHTHPLTSREIIYANNISVAAIDSGGNVAVPGTGLMQRL